MRGSYRVCYLVVLVALIAVANGGCRECDSTGDCGLGAVCVDGMCESASNDWDTSDGDADGDTDGDTDTDTDTDTDPSSDIEWVNITGGDFVMGDNPVLTSQSLTPTISVADFQIAKTEITVLQYSACTGAGACSLPEMGGRMNYGANGKTNYPINGVSWDQAYIFCGWTGGRMVSESEWEYAAKSQGLDNAYPWGNADIDCDYSQYEDLEEGLGCGVGNSLSVCSNPAGNTEQGLCDMSGNVWEWVADEWHDQYDLGPPADGTAWGTGGLGGSAVIRGGSYQTANSESTIDMLSTTGRYPFYGSEPDLGFRCARDL